MQSGHTIVDHELLEWVNVKICRWEKERIRGKNMFIVSKCLHFLDRKYKAICLLYNRTFSKFRRSIPCSREPCTNAKRFKLSFEAGIETLCRIKVYNGTLSDHKRSVL